MSTSRPAATTSTFRVKLRKKNPTKQSQPPEKPNTRVPRVARLLALAHRIDGMIRSGELKNWAEAARLIGVTRARMTQIANLMLLGPEIQTVILDSSSISDDKHPTTERDLRLLHLRIHWKDQRYSYHTRPLPRQYPPTNPGSELVKPRGEIGS